jgi:hypothetical protein
MGAAGSSGKLVPFYQATWFHIPDDSNFHILYRKKPKLQSITGSFSTGRPAVPITVAARFKA